MEGRGQGEATPRCLVRLQLWSLLPRLVRHLNDSSEVLTNALTSLRGLCLAFAPG